MICSSPEVNLHNAVNQEINEKPRWGSELRKKQTNDKKIDHSQGEGFYIERFHGNILFTYLAF